MENSVFFQFGASVINPGQKLNVAEPELVAKSTNGTLAVTAPVSKKLGIAPGEKISIGYTHENVRQAVQARHSAIVEYCEANGIDINDPASENTIVNAFGRFFIFKGVPAYTPNGKRVMAKVRTSADVKNAWLDETDKDSGKLNRILVAESMDEADRIEFADANNLADSEVATVAAALTDKDVESKTVPDFTGSRTSTSGTGTGIGCPLNFSDQNIWNMLKENLAEPMSVNRVFSVDLDNPTTVPVSNGYEMVNVTAYVISDTYTDKEPVRRNGNASEEAIEEEAIEE